MSREETGAGWCADLVRGGLIALVSMIALSVTTPSSASQFGTRCQKAYQNGWQTELSYAWSRCGGFNDEMDDTDTKDFYYNMKGTLYEFYDFWFGLFGPSKHYGVDHSPAAAGADTVDLLYVSTHGGVMGNMAILAGWEQDRILYSPLMRLGDDDDRLRILSQYACDTLKIDNASYNRWIRPFRGGLQIITGSHDKVYDGYYLDDTGEDYADELQDGTSVKWAWFDGLWDTYTDQDVAVYATGLNQADCLFRLGHLTWHNKSNFSRIYDGDIGYMCASWITDY